MPHAEWVAFSTLIPILLSNFIGSQVSFLIAYAFQRLQEPTGIDATIKDQQLI